MLSVGNIIDIGNIIFFIANFPQLITSFKNRQNMGAVSGKMLLGYMMATIFFMWSGILTGGYICTALGVVNEIIWSLQLYWKRKYRNKDDEWSPERIAEMEIERSQGK